MRNTLHRSMSIFKVALLLFISAVLFACSSGSSSSGSSGSGSTDLGTLPNGSTISISSGTIPVTVSESASATLSISGGTPDTFLITFESSVVQGTNIHNAADIATATNGIVIQCSSTPCAISSGGTAPSSTNVNVAASANTPAGTYTITPVATDDSGVTTKLSPITIQVNGSSDSSAKAMISYSINGVAATINGPDITLTLPFGTDPTNLVATFVTNGASVSVNGVTQVSGTTANDFSKPVNYVITAQDGSTATDIVTVTIAQSPADEMTAYSINGTAGTFNGTNISVVLPFGTNLESLVATFTITGTSATVNGVTQVSGVTANNFSNGPVTYVVHAADGVSTQNYRVTVTTASSSAKAITSYSINGVAGVFSGENNESISVTLPYGSDRIGLIADFTTTGVLVTVPNPITGTPVVQVSGMTVNNFVTPVVYTVTAADGSTQNYTVTVTIAPNTANSITSYSIKGESGIIGPDNNIVVTLPFGTQVQFLIATFTTDGAKSVTVNGQRQISGFTPNNFESPVTYVVTADSGATQTYTVTVVIAPNNQANMVVYSIEDPQGRSHLGMIDGTNIAVVMPYGTSTESLVAKFITSLGATATVNGESQVSGVTPNNFSSPLPYVITAGDGITQKTYTVTVTVAQSPAANITAFSINNPAGGDPIPATITGEYISVTMPFGTSTESLVANFTTDGQSVTVDDVTQTSGVTVNNFNHLVVYTVHAFDGVHKKRYLVNVMVARNTDATITSYCFGTNCGVINQTPSGGDITVTVPYGTDTTSLIATYTTAGILVTVPHTILDKEVNIPQRDGITANDFSNPPVVYTVTAADFKTKLTYNVYVVVAQNTAKDITSYSINGYPGVISGENIVVTLPSNTQSLLNLVATFTTTGESVYVAGVLQTSGVTSNDFVRPVTYTVFAADGSSQNYLVTVNIASPSSALITSYSIGGSLGVITGNDISVTVPYGTNLSIPMIATFTTTTTFGNVKVNGTTQISGVSPNNFSNPVVYTVTSQDGSVTSNYTVTVTVGPQPGDLITSFSLRGSTGVEVAGKINDAAGTINVVMPWSTKSGNMIATFSTTGERVTVPYTFETHGQTITINVPQSGVFGIHDFANPVVYTVTASDGSQKQYTVTVTILQNAMTSFALTDVLSLGVYAGTITQNTDGTGGTIAVSVPYGSTIFSAAYTNSPGTLVFVGLIPQVPLVTKNNYADPVTFSVRALPNNVAKYTVTVTEAAPSASTITSYSLTVMNESGESMTFPGVIDQRATPKTIQVPVPARVNVSQAVANFVTTGTSTVTVPQSTFPFFTVQQSGVTANNFESGAVIKYTSTSTNPASVSVYNVSVVNRDDE